MSEQWKLHNLHEHIADLDAEIERLALAVSNRDKRISLLEKVAEAALELEQGHTFGKYGELRQAIRDTLRETGYL